MGDITSNFNPNTCIDSVAPTITVNEGSVASGFRVSDSKYWFKAGTYAVPATDADSHTLASGLDTCFYRIKDLGTGSETVLASRTCSTTIPLTVGVGLNCQTENENNCQLELHAWDKAGNLKITTKKLHVDRTAPSAQ